MERFLKHYRLLMFYCYKQNDWFLQVWLLRKVLCGMPNICVGDDYCYINCEDW